MTNFLRPFQRETMSFTYKMTEHIGRTFYF
jgi:hypothetical protein